MRHKFPLYPLFEKALSAMTFDTNLHAAMRVLLHLIFLLHLVAPHETSHMHSHASSNAVCTLNPAMPTATSAYATILSMHHDTDAECPQAGQMDVHYHNEDDYGCCTQSATLTIVGGAAGCCPCGAICTGSVPAMVDWHFSGSRTLAFSLPEDHLNETD